MDGRVNGGLNLSRLTYFFFQKIMVLTTFCKNNSKSFSKITKARSGAFLSKSLIENASNQR